MDNIWKQYFVGGAIWIGIFHSGLMIIFICLSLPTGILTLNFNIVGEMIFELFFFPLVFIFTIVGFIIFIKREIRIDRKKW